MTDVCIVTKTWRYSIAWIVHSLAQALLDAGCAVCLIAPLSEPESREAHSPRLTRVTLHRERVGPAGRLARTAATLRRILGGLAATLAERRRTRVFLVTIPDPLPVTLVMFLLLRLSGARVLFMVHDVVPHAWTLGRRLRSLERAAHGLSYTLASELIVLTPALKRALGADFAIPAGKITVIPHGPLELGDLPPPPGAGRLLLFGSLRRNKSVAEVIEAVSLARRDDPQLTLVIAGEPHPSEPGYWEACRAAIARDPAGFDVREGFVADTDLPGLVAGIDAFVLAYRDFESQSGVAVLAALAARPSLCTTSGGLADLIAEGLTHQPIASPVTAPAVAAAIRAFRARPFAAWRDQAEASRRHFAGTLSWQAIGARYLERIRDPGR